MGFSLSARRRARALRVRFLDKKNFLPTIFGQPGPKVRTVARPHTYPQQENRDLHATAKHFAEMARGQERLMERARWSRG